MTMIYRVTTICWTVIYRFDCNGFSSEMKPSKCPGKEKKWGKKEKRRADKANSTGKIETAVSLLSTKTILNYFAFCACLKLGS